MGGKAYGLQANIAKTCAEAVDLGNEHLEYPHLLKGQLNDTLENKGLAENFFP